MGAEESPQYPQYAVSGSASRSADELLFSQAALLTGRSLYWDGAPVGYAHDVHALIDWCLDLPHARLGVTPQHVARLLFGICAVTGDPLSGAEIRLFERFDVEYSRMSPWAPDKVWVERKPDLVRWLESAPSRAENIWLEPDDARMWLEATRESLLSYAELFDIGVDSRSILNLLRRHRCTVFAPFDGAATWDHLDALVVSAISDTTQQSEYRQQLRETPLSRAECEATTGMYWSWRLLDFSEADGAVIYTPLLSLWTYQPADAAWAPPSPAPVATGAPGYTGRDIAYVLNDVFWLRLETLFSLAREVCGVGEAISAFGNVETRPPVFFVAAPAQPPTRAEEFVESWRDAIAPLASRCLLVEDPLAIQVAWGVVDGRIVTVRRETPSREFYRPRYLLLPIAVSAATTIESEVGIIADQLTYLEFNIGITARNTDSDMMPLVARSSLWGGALDRVAEVTGDAADYLASVGRRDAAAINRRLSNLHMILRRFETFIEAATSNGSEVQRAHAAALDNTDDFIRRTLTMSALAHPLATNLRTALLNAYPYQFVKEPLRVFDTTMRDLVSSIERSSMTVSAILDQSDRQSREALASLGRWLGALVTLLALVVGLLQVTGSQSAGFIVAHLPWITLAAPELFTALGALLIIAALVYGLLWLQQLRPRRRHPFIEETQHFRAVTKAALGLRDRALDAQAQAVSTSMANQTRAHADMMRWWRDLDTLDDEASLILAGLWRKLRDAQAEMTDQAQGFRRRGAKLHVEKPSVREWAAREQSLENTIELFDLAPNRILLPRTLCVLRFKSTDFYERTTISTGDFLASLRHLGYSSDDVRALEFWLSAPANQRPIREWDVETFTRMLKQHGVSAIPMPEYRTPARWTGSLAAQP